MRDLSLDAQMEKHPLMEEVVRLKDRNAELETARDEQYVFKKV